jgi:uncharacterized protein YecT (DUF1311 family)
MLNTHTMSEKTYFYHTIYKFILWLLFCIGSAGLLSAYCKAESKPALQKMTFTGITKPGPATGMITNEKNESLFFAMLPAIGHKLMRTCPAGSWCTVEAMVQEDNFIMELVSVELIEALERVFSSERNTDKQKTQIQDPIKNQEEIPKPADVSNLGIQTYTGRVVVKTEVQSKMAFWYLLDEKTNQLIFLTAPFMDKDKVLETCMGGIIDGGLEFLATHGTTAVSMYHIELTGEARNDADGGIALFLDGSRCRRNTEQPAPPSPSVSPQANAHPQAAQRPTTPAIRIRPSFDCAKAQTPVELAICSDASLTQLDVTMVNAYALVSRSLADKKPLIAEQRAWIKARNECASSADPVRCIRQQLTTRIQQLERYLSPSASSAR